MASNLRAMASTLLEANLLLSIVLHAVGISAAMCSSALMTKARKQISSCGIVPVR